MPLTDSELKLLVETRDHAVRSAERIEEIHARLDAGDALLDNHQKRLLKIESICAPCALRDKTRRKWIYAGLVALLAPAAVTVWNWIVALLKGKTP